MGEDNLEPLDGLGAVARELLLAARNEAGVALTEHIPSVEALVHDLSAITTRLASYMKRSEYGPSPPGTDPGVVQQTFLRVKELHDAANAMLGELRALEREQQQLTHE
jgi:hypothetical protein